MPDNTTEEIFSSPQINIPPTFPFILKQYAKAAIRTQPYDLLRWSASYFRALAKGEEPPIKDRLEYPPPDTPSGLSPGYLKVLIKQIGKGGVVTVSQLMERWSGICLAEEPLQEMLAVGQFGETFDWLHFVAVAAGFLSNNLTQTMVLLCNLLTDEPDGGSAMIPLQIFTKLYTFLASLDCGGIDDQDEESEEQRQYIISAGLRDEVSLYSRDSASLKRESVESCPTDPSIYKVNWGSHSAHQLYVETSSPFPSPNSSRPCTPYHNMENASTTTLTPQSSRGVHPESEDGAHLETFYDAEVKGSIHSSQELTIEGNNLKMTEPLTTSPGLSSGSDHDKRSVSLIQQRSLDEPKLTTSISAPNTAYTYVTEKASPSKPANGRGDVDEKLFSPKVLSQEPVVKSKRVFHVPGIGAAIDAVQMQAVIDYLEGVGIKQDGMVKPCNIRHFLCPPLEKVPASQKTRV
ncbi:uncharacterized protein LOC113209355 isoform X1 [Frankliniella occidentalis]|uniref:Uncharacterized protein LOC113209355 isoform X1 n=1 Tax=Frankliniella occidentalis TaxID=133901 RepID=A0A6J1SVW4_FRAOC|nr:uncharacterized protein LOC113209355 isoform X1 [Frankliniella occidentalis]